MIYLFIFKKSKKQNNQKNNLMGIRQSKACALSWLKLDGNSGGILFYLKKVVWSPRFHSTPKLAKWVKLARNGKKIQEFLISDFDTFWLREQNILKSALKNFQICPNFRPIWPTLEPNLIYLFDQINKNGAGGVKLSMHF